MENKKLELMTQDLSAGYDGKTIVSDVSITIPKNKISVILGANGCGKSTLLKTFAKLLKPEQGNILLDGKSIFSMPSKQMAQTLGLLPQSPIVPEGIKVTDLVARGRFPYRKLLGGLQKDDFAAVEEALEMIAAWMNCQADSARESGLRLHWHSRRTFYCWMSQPPIWISLIR